MSKEYSIAAALTIGAILKAFGIEIDNTALEAAVFGIGTILIMVFRYKKGDITLTGVKKIN